MEFRLLGPLQLLGNNGAAIDLGGRQQRLIVAFLLLRANQVVSVDSLVDALWGEQPPATAVKSVQVQISRLRRALGAAHGDGPGARLRTSGSGYLLLVHPHDAVQRLRKSRKKDIPEWWWSLFSKRIAEIGATLRMSS